MAKTRRLPLRCLVFTSDSPAERGLSGPVGLVSNSSVGCRMGGGFGLTVVSHSETGSQVACAILAEVQLLRGYRAVCSVRLPTVYPERLLRSRAWRPVRLLPGLH